MLQQVLVCQEIQKSDSQHTEFVLLAMDVITNNDKVFRVLFLILVSHLHRKNSVFISKYSINNRKTAFIKQKTAKCCIVNYTKNVF